MNRFFCFSRRRDGSSSSVTLAWSDLADAGDHHARTLARAGAHVTSCAPGAWMDRFLPVAGSTSSLQSGTLYTLMTTSLVTGSKARRASMDPSKLHDASHMLDDASICGSLRSGVHVRTSHTTSAESQCGLAMAVPQSYPFHVHRYRSHGDHTASWQPSCGMRPIFSKECPPHSTTPRPLENVSKYVPCGDHSV